MKVKFNGEECTVEGFMPITLGSPDDDLIDVLGITTAEPIPLLNDFFGVTDLTLAIFVNIVKSRTNPFAIDLLTDENVNAYMYSEQLNEQLDKCDIKDRRLKIYEANHSDLGTQPVKVEFSNEDKKMMFLFLFEEGLKLLQEAV